MKKILIIVSALVLIPSVYAQEVEGNQIDETLEIYDSSVPEFQDIESNNELNSTDITSDSYDQIFTNDFQDLDTGGEPTVATDLDFGDDLPEVSDKDDYSRNLSRPMVTNIDNPDTPQSQIQTGKKYNSWSVFVAGGVPMLVSSDLTSLRNGQSKSWRFGYEVQFGVTKQITHAVQISVMGQYGQTRQGLGYGPVVKAKTEYIGVVALGGINLSALLRRIDRNKPFKLAWMFYGGGGFLGYDVKRQNVASGETGYQKVVDQKGDLRSMYGMIGSGVKYKLNKKLDLELRGMYVLTGDEAFDGSTTQWDGAHPGNNSDNFVSITAGVHYKIGRGDDNIGWVDPLREIMQTINSGQGNLTEVCINGDNDQDGVCDDWDKELDTPFGARVDGSGRALDTDLDGVIDLYDKCVTFPGPASNQGCPEALDVAQTLNEELARFGGIDFDFDSAVITPSSYSFLDNAADIITKYGQGNKFIVEGHTDAAGTPQYNISLSQRRVESVVRYIESKGVTTGDLIPVGKGMSELKHPECNPVTKCSEVKNRENRRVIFKISQ